MVLAAATVVSAHLDQTQQQNAGSSRWGLCVLAAPNAILDHSTLGREATLLPAAEMASALAFHVAQCLFCFYFCFVTRESLGNSGSRPAPSAAGRPQGPQGPRLPHPIPAFPTNARRGPRFRGQRELLLLPGAEGDSAGWIQPKRFFCFPLRVSRVQLPAIDDSCRHSPLPPASFLGDKSTKD